MSEVTVLIVPGLRDHVAEHWQTLVAARLPRVRVVDPMGREDLDCARRVAAIEREANAIKGPMLESEGWKRDPSAAGPPQPRRQRQGPPACLTQAPC